MVRNNGIAKFLALPDFARARRLLSTTILWNPLTIEASAHKTTHVPNRCRHLASFNPLRTGEL